MGEGEAMQLTLNDLVKQIIHIGEINSKLEKSKIDMKVAVIVFPYDYYTELGELNHFTRVRKAIENNGITVKFNDDTKEEKTLFEIT